MRAGGGKAKGAKFERDVCQRLSLWVTQGHKRDCFWRSAMSGGRATLGKRKGHDMARQAGDICAVASEGHVLTDRFYIECKHVKNLSLTAFMLQGAGQLVRYWAKACDEARDHGRYPMLIAKQNGRPIIVLLRPAALRPGVLFANETEPLAQFNLGNSRKVCIVLFEQMLNYEFCQQYKPPKVQRVRLKG